MIAQNDGPCPPLTRFQQVEDPFVLVDSLLPLLRRLVRLIPRALDAAGQTLIYALERAGRYDVIEQNAGVEDSVRLYGLLLTDPVLYAVMAKVDHIIRNKEADSVSFARLQETRVSHELFMVAKDHVSARWI